MTNEAPSFIPFAAPCVDQQEVEAIAEVLDSGWITTGPKSREFAAAFARFKGVEHALGVNSCTAAMWIALESLGVGPGDEVITTPVTFASTAGVVEHLGAKPVFVDVEPDTGNMDADRIEEHVTERTKAILPVHLGGRPVRMGKVVEVAGRHGFRVVEDCAHAIEAVWQNRPVGTIGDAGCFSFYATKNLTTGEGGMLLSPDPELIERCRVKSLHGLSADAWERITSGGHRHYLVEHPGYKFNLTDIQAAMGLVQLAKLENHARHRHRLWDYYMEALEDLPLFLPPPVPEGNTHARHLFSPRLDLERVTLSRDEFLQRLHEQGIGTSVHFVSLHLHPFYRDKYGYRPENFPEALRYARCTFSLPFTGCLPLSKAEYVVARVRDMLLEHRR